ncbi:unnamed protein product [Hermetia illucens]|uniref:Uncharacterized protein n=1 Tax=Hermetia illucens TaxID=343691 RepID=A0A7R8UFT8_HERIL|nr:unnamed protein product [Hermetia illucens]
MLKIQMLEQIVTSDAADNEQKQQRGQEAPPQQHQSQQSPQQAEKRQLQQQKSGLPKNALHRGSSPSGLVV